jgi:RNA polymerase sigma-70 factor, ECF subfamily
MRDDTNEGRGLNPSITRDGTSTKCAALLAWISNTPAARLGEASSVTVDREPDTDSIASDDQLLATAQSGNQQAFAELCRRHLTMVTMRIFSIVRSQQGTEDALQDTLLRAYRHLHGIRRTRKFSSWLTTIRINTALMIAQEKNT